MEDRYNYGIGAFKILLCIEVIAAHFQGEVSSFAGDFITKYCMYAAALFMIISFYYCSKDFSNSVREIVKKRGPKLLVPYLAWPVFFVFVYSICDRFMGTNYGGLVGELKWQILFGHSLKIDSVLWFQWVLILTTILFVAISHISSIKVRGVIISFLIVASFCLQYSGCNYYLMEIFPIEMAYPIGRLVEMVPYASIGYVISKLEIDKFHGKLRNNLYSVIFILVGFLVVNSSVLPVPEGYAYQGITKYIACILFFVGVLLFSTEKMPRVIKLFIRKGARYTTGIYCSHVLIGTLFSRLNGVTLRISETFLLDLTIFAMGYVFCLVISKIPLKVCKLLIL